jgi:flagellar export protein FliJ
MKRFKFSLESLRVLRQQKERAAQLRYARALVACSNAEIQLQSAAVELEANWNLLRGELTNIVGVNRLVQLRTWSTVLEIRWNERKGALIEARRIAELAFQEMLAATRDREGLDRFHDKARRVHEQKAQREEQKYFDEMAVQSGESRGLLQFAGHENAY